MAHGKTQTYTLSSMGQNLPDKVSSLGKAIKNSWMTRIEVRYAWFLGLPKSCKRSHFCRKPTKPQTFLLCGKPASSVQHSFALPGVKTSKSACWIFRVAYEPACQTLSAHRCKFSPRKFAQPQHLPCLVLKEFARLDGRHLGQASEQRRLIPEFFWHGAEAYGFRGQVRPRSCIAEVIESEREQSRGTRGAVAGVRAGPQPLGRGR